MTEPIFGFPIFQPGTFPGPQVVTLTIEAADYGLASSAYAVREIDPLSGELVELGETLDFASGSAQLQMTVDARSARFLVLAALDDCEGEEEEDDD